ncbi:hypothetical protein Bccel_2631 [Pseudobacteroides cellulosolvens ATCC 35603 = DSM 2933]|uniref:Uncharacterized protein n=1 Tax=Pseudobacteroides cellulosolvens ATCC 35603 = DSM 2933 TaxID=398512 RepID=A0A0L6JNT3_9FIRM|nr:hypothetical protein Bccel_2631 [Pseudobacteroides cellulosolvens ATCC 35603 = DSM 2933]
MLIKMKDSLDDDEIGVLLKIIKMRKENISGNILYIDLYH